MYRTYKFALKLCFCIEKRKSISRLRPWTPIGGFAPGSHRGPGPHKALARCAPRVFTFCASALNEAPNHPLPTGTRKESYATEHIELKLVMSCLLNTCDKYTAKLLFHQSPTRHIEHTVTIQWRYTFSHTVVNCWQQVDYTVDQLYIFTLLLIVINSDYTVTVQSPCSHCAYSRLLME